MLRVKSTELIKIDFAPYRRDPDFLPQFSVLWIAFAAFLRGMPMFVATRPRTPLRVLCLIAFDTRHWIRNARQLPWWKIKVLAALLDYGAYANAALDGKHYDVNEQRATERILDAAGMRPLRLEYLGRLRRLERTRPCIGGPPSHFPEVRSYREAVIRLSLGLIVAVAEGHGNLDDGIGATHSDATLEVLFRIVMQCQVIDDVLDYSGDVASGLPSFLTVSESLRESVQFARSTSKRYAGKGLPPSGETLPFRFALRLVSHGARILLWAGDVRPWWGFPKHRISPRPGCG